MIFPFRSLPVASFRGISILVASVATLAMPAQARPRAAHKEVSNSVAYKGAIVIDAASGKVLVEDRADEVSPPASMTKLMTYAVLWDKLSSGALTLETPVKVEASDAKIGGTQVYLDPRETFPVEDLIYAMMIQSANDAAHALARVSAGSIPAFVELMNAKARELGMTHTTFRSPHGLPPEDRRIADGDLTTPRDYSLLCRYLLLHTDVLKYTSVRERDFAPNRPHGAMRMENHNKLLGKVAGVDGLKTGYTKGAGYCLSATAERNGHRVILVIMGSLGPGGTADLGRTRDIKAIELIERGFSEFPAGGPDFDTERAKYVKPSVIPLDNSAAGVPATSALPATPANPSAAATAPAADTPSSGPVIKLNLPHS